MIKSRLRTQLTALSLIVLTACGGSSDNGSSNNEKPQPVIDHTPDAVNFNAVNDAPQNTPVSSNSVTITGISDNTPISITNGEYQINSNGFTSQSGVINNNQTLTVRLTSSAQFQAQTQATLTIGTATVVFSITTLAQDVEPDPIAFEHLTDQPRNSAVQSQSHVITGITDTTPISIENGRFRINEGAFDNKPETINNNDTVTVELTTSDSYNTASNALLTIGTATFEYSATTSSAQFIEKYVRIAGEKNNTLYLYTEDDIWTLPSGTTHLTHKLSSKQLKDERANAYQGFSYAKLIDEHLFVQRNLGEYDLDLWLINEDIPLQSQYVLRSGDTHDHDYRIRPFAEINDRFIFKKHDKWSSFSPSLSSSPVSDPSEVNELGFGEGGFSVYGDALYWGTTYEDESGSNIAYVTKSDGTPEGTQKLIELPVIYHDNNLDEIAEFGPINKIDDQLFFRYTKDIGTSFQRGWTLWQASDDGSNYIEYNEQAIALKALPHGIAYLDREDDERTFNFYMRQPGVANATLLGSYVCSSTCYYPSVFELNDHIVYEFRNRVSDGPDNYQFLSLNKDSGQLSEILMSTEFIVPDSRIIYHTHNGKLYLTFEENSRDIWHIDAANSVASIIGRWPESVSYWHELYPFNNDLYLINKGVWRLENGTFVKVPKN